jgi:hypothetical protein
MLMSSGPAVATRDNVWVRERRSTISAAFKLTNVRSGRPVGDAEAGMFIISRTSRSESFE